LTITVQLLSQDSQWRLKTSTRPQEAIPADVSIEGLPNPVLYFVIGTLLYNAWLMANFILRDAVDVDLGEHPPILAGELIELVAFCLFDRPTEQLFCPCDLILPSDSSLF